MNWNLPRAPPVTTLEILRQLNVIDEEQLKALAKFGPSKQLRNHRDLVTGNRIPCFNFSETKCN